MDDVERLLRDAGARWRASQPGPPQIGDVALVNARPHTFGWPVVAASAAMGAVAAVIVMAALALAAQVADGSRIGVGAPVASSTDSAPPATAACGVTVPNPPFSAPPPYPASPPDASEAWFGTPELWTMLELDGEVWDAANASFPVGQKLFWWSSNWAGMREEPEPALTVVATRLDGPGTVRTDDATNAAADSLGGQAMLSGIEFPTPGCWQVTGEYRGAVLSYVVWVKDE